MMDIWRGIFWGTNLCTMTWVVHLPSMPVATRITVWTIFSRVSRGSLITFHLPLLLAGGTAQTMTFLQRCWLCSMLLKWHFLLSKRDYFPPTSEKMIGTLFDYDSGIIYITRIPGKWWPRIWRCISYWKWVIFQLVMLVYERVIFLLQKNRSRWSILGGSTWVVHGSTPHCGSGRRTKNSKNPPNLGERIWKIPPSQDSSGQNEGFGRDSLLKMSWWWLLLGKGITQDMT